MLAPRADVDSVTKQKVFDGLKETWFETPDNLARKLNLDRSVVLGALAAYTQAGRAIYDLEKGVYRVRELSRNPLPFDKLRFANEREESANKFIERNGVKITLRETSSDGSLVLDGEVKDGNYNYTVSITIDNDQKLAHAYCNCSFFKMNKLYKGPCEHILALRMASARK